MKKLYDLAVKNGSYEKNGETKGRYVNVGALMEGDNGPFLFISAHVNFAAFPRRDGSESVIVKCFEPKQKDGHDWKAAEQRETVPQSRPAATDDFNDEINF